jgi:adenosylcobinamide-GDP ribazoletransferase
MRGLVTAVRTLTVVPCPGRDADNFASSLPFFPLVGGCIGVVVAAVAAAFYRLDWVGSGPGVVAVVIAALLTRGLHLDGLADTFDALGGGRTPARRLEIMKDPHTGAFGVVAIVGDFLLKAAAINLLVCYGWRWVALPFLAGRTAQVVLAVVLPYARATTGTAEGFVRAARPHHLVTALVVATALGLALAGPWSAVVLAAGLLIAALLALWMRRVFGGVTGDLLGMANETVETLLLLALGSAAAYLHLSGAPVK